MKQKDNTSVITLMIFSVELFTYIFLIQIYMHKSTYLCNTIQKYLYKDFNTNRFPEF